MRRFGGKRNLLWHPLVVIKRFRPEKEVEEAFATRPGTQLRLLPQYLYP